MNSTKLLWKIGRTENRRKRGSIAREISVLNMRMESGGIITRKGSGGELYKKKMKEDISPLFFIQKKRDFSK